MYCQIKWENRLQGDNGSTCLCTVDGTDYRIQEPAPFDRKWYSHKFKGPGLRYEVAVCIQTGWIVWTNGPYPCGSWPDIKIARDKILRKLRVRELLLADGGYSDNGTFFETPTGHNNVDQRMKALARARHETINRRLKCYSVLGDRYRHHICTHFQVFKACSNLVQLDIMVGRPPFQVEYFDGGGTRRRLFDEEQAEVMYNRLCGTDDAPPDTEEAGTGTVP
jgi:hypothetical protein